MTNKQFFDYIDTSLHHCNNVNDCYNDDCNDNDNDSDISKDKDSDNDDDNRNHNKNNDDDDYYPEIYTAHILK